MAALNNFHKQLFQQPVKGNCLGKRAQGYSIVQVSVPPHVYNQEQTSRSAGLGFGSTWGWALLGTFRFQRKGD